MTLKPEIATVPATKYQTPLTYVNHVQISSLGDHTYMDFRHIHPDSLSEEYIEATRGKNGVEIKVQADLGVIPPHCRLILPDYMAQELMGLLQKRFEKDE